MGMAENGTRWLEKAENGWVGDETVGNGRERAGRGRDSWEWLRTGEKGTRRLEKAENGWVGDETVGKGRERAGRGRDGWKRLRTGG